MPEKLSVDEKAVRGLAKLLEETGLTEIEYQVGTQRVRVARSGVSALVSSPLPPPTHKPSAAPSPGETSSPSPGSSSPQQGEIVPSPMVGTVYLASEPGANPFIKTGGSVKKGDTLLIIEAMKVMNPIRAPRDGKILDICVSDRKPVEFGEPLVILE